MLSLVSRAATVTATATNASSLPPGFNDAAYLRVASMAVGAYELICTLPAAYRFYRQQVLRRALSQQCGLFILIRYLSIAVVVVSNVGFFGHFPSLDACRRFVLVSPVLKALQTLASQLILSTRTYSISRKSRWVLWTMLGTLAVSVPIEFFTDIYQRTPVHNLTTLNCTSANAASHRIAWINYLAAMVFDVVAICISSGYLWAYSATATRISHFVQTLLYEGLGYFVVLTAVNIFNLVLYLDGSESTESTGASLGYVIIFIMSQRILIRQREYADRYAESEQLSDREVSISVSRPLDSTREINDALRSQFEYGAADSFASKSGGALALAFEGGDGGGDGGGGAYTTLSVLSSSLPSPQPRSPAQSQAYKSQIRGQRRLGDKDKDRDREVLDLDLESALVGATPQGHAHGVGAGAGAQTQTHSAATGSALDVQVRIEHTVTVERTRAGLGRESYKKPRVMWEHHHHHRV